MKWGSGSTQAVFLLVRSGELKRFLAAQVGLKLDVRLEMTLNSSSSYVYTLIAGAPGLHHRAWFHLSSCKAVNKTEPSRTRELSLQGML